MTVAAVALAALVEDLSLYPRSQVNNHHVSRLVSALEAGVFLPPPVADRASMRIIDGFHRRRAHLKFDGTDGVIDVDLVDYESELEMFREAIRLNSGHGLQLQEIDRRRMALRLTELGESDERIGVVLRVPPPKVQRMKLRVATVTRPGGQFRTEVLKPSLYHLVGGAISEEQAKANKSAPGTSYSLLVKQLRDALQLDLINRSDGRVISGLQGLLVDLQQYLDGEDGVPVVAS